MGFFKKLIGTAAVTGAAVGGALYIKKRKEENSTGTDFEDFDDEKIFDVNKDCDKDGNQKITITFNSRKAKQVADSAADKVIDVTDKAKNVVVEKLGEEKVDYMKDKAQDVKDILNDAASYAMDKAKDAKDIVVDKVGEDNIQAVKEKVEDAVDLAKDKVSETVDKIIKPSSTTVDADYSEDDFVDEDIVNEDIETEDDVNMESDIADDDILQDELDEI